MLYTDDPVRDAMKRDKEHQMWLDSLPVCERCKEPIQDRQYYEIEGAKICSECLTEYCDEQYQVKNTELEN